jgi:hypothetical protein
VADMATETRYRVMNQMNDYPPEHCLYLPSVSVEEFADERGTDFKAKVDGFFPDRVCAVFVFEPQLRVAHHFHERAQFEYVKSRQV